MNSDRAVFARMMLCLILIILLASPTSVTSFNLKGASFKRVIGTLRAADTCLAASSIGSSDRASRFHSDMHRVLESRENLASNISLTLSPLERRQRPEILRNDVDGAERVASMLRHMIEIGVATEESYQIVMKALCQRGRLRWRREGRDSSIVCAADEVGLLFDEIWEMQDGQVSTDTCNLALEAYAVCSTPRGNRNYASRAQEVLDNMKDSDIEVSIESLDHVMHAWAWEQQNLKPGSCAEKAQACFDEMLTHEPDVDTLMKGYNWILEAWSKSSSDGSSEKAERIFQKMLDIRRDHPECMFPNAQSYSNAILAWTKNHGQSAQKAHNILLKTLDNYEKGLFPEGEEPELIAFNGVISAWARMGKPDKAEEVLWMADGLRLKCDALEPDIVSYNSVLHAFVRKKNGADVLDRVIGIVEYLEANAESRPVIRPDSFTYSMLMKAWLQSCKPDKALQAEKCLLKMCDLWSKGDKATEPSNRHFNIVINALAKSRDKIDARRAHGLFLKMQALPGCQPDIISYTSVIECFSKSDEPHAAEISMELLQQATDIYEQTKNPSIMPNLRTYAVAIQALATNPVIENVQRAKDLLTQLHDLYEETGDEQLRPNAYPYNYVLNCAANCIGTDKEKLRSFQVAAQTYNEMRKSSEIPPDSYTYAFWFKACNNLLPVGEIRGKGLVYAFDQCKAEGLVSAETLKRLLGGTPPALIYKLLDIEEGTSPKIYRRLTIDDFPPNWSRNIR